MIIKLHSFFWHCSIMSSEPGLLKQNAARLTHYHKHKDMWFFISVSRIRGHVWDYIRLIDVLMNIVWHSSRDNYWIIICHGHFTTSSYIDTYRECLFFYRDAAVRCLSCLYQMLSDTDQQLPDSLILLMSIFLNLTENKFDLLVGFLRDICSHYFEENWTSRSCII